MSSSPSSPLPTHRPSTPAHPSLRTRTRSRSEADPERASQDDDGAGPSEYPRPPSPREYEAPAAPPGEEVTPLRLAAHYAGLVPMSLVGTLIRLGLVALGTYDGAVIFPLAWVQGVGCAIMGTALSRKPEIAGLYPPLYTAITTGLAGSVTTFSSWMLEGYISFADLGGYNRKGLHDTVDGVVYSFATWAIAHATLRFGEMVARILPPSPVRPHPKPAPPNSASSSDTAPAEEKPRQRHALHVLVPARTPLVDISTIFLGLLFYAGALILYFVGPTSWRFSVTFPLLLAPPGAMLRFALSRLNTRDPFLDRFPLGTFLANMLATAVLGGVYAAQRSNALQLSAVRCNALNAIEQGFCGCLSTVSTFTVESRTIKGMKWTWLYVVGSVVLGHILMLAIVGGVSWSVGLKATC